MCSTLAQENAEVYNGNGLEVCNVGYAYVPMMMCYSGRKSLQINEGGEKKRKRLQLQYFMGGDTIDGGKLFLLFLFLLGKSEKGWWRPPCLKYKGPNISSMEG